MIVATLITAQSLRPTRPLGLTMSAAFIGTSFVSLHGYKSDAGGLLAASSGLYAVMAMRRKFGLRDRFGPRGILRGVTVGLCAIDVVSGLLVYVGRERGPAVVEKVEEVVEGKT
jgi:hypothetical protein